MFTAAHAILKKLLRTLFFFLTVRAAVLAMAETYLLGRALYSCIARGMFTDPSKALDEANLLRAAMRIALAGTDRQILITAMRRSWRQLRERRGIVARLLRFPRRRRELAPAALATEDRETVEKNSTDILHHIHQPEVQEFLKKFDHRLALALANSPPSPN